jgi:hypothetical protein
MLDKDYDIWYNIYVNKIWEVLKCTKYLD